MKYNKLSNNLSRNWGTDVHDDKEGEKVCEICLGLGM